MKMVKFYITFIKEIVMALLTLLLSGMACVLLQFLTRNLLYLFVGMAGIVAAIVLNKYYENEKKLWCLPSIIINTLLFLVAIGWHLCFGAFVYDYIIIAVLLGLFNLLIITEIFPFIKKRKNKNIY